MIESFLFLMEKIFGEQQCVLKPKRGCRATPYALPALQDGLRLAGETKICSVLSPCADPCLNPSILVKILRSTAVTETDSYALSPR